ncbi:MAG: alcohol dehydrogenase, partial [Proteobacteria bacterium]|nr:alcohol dehydrogenase [Pseudomonadota bacterium]
KRNQPAIEDKMNLLARTLNLPGTGIDAVLAWVNTLRDKLSIPNTLAAIKMTEEHCTLLAPLALQDPSAGGNPIALTEHDYEQLFRAALNG